MGADGGMCWIYPKDGYTKEDIKKLIPYDTMTTKSGSSVY